MSRKYPSTPARLPRAAALLLLLALLPALSGCGNSGNAAASGSGAASKKALVKLNIADTNTNPVFKVAKAKGFFKNNGIDATIVNFGTPAEGVNALFIKQVDIAYGADFPLLNAVSKGEYSIIASAGQATDQAASVWKLYVRNDIQSAADLKGKKLSFMRGTFLPYLWDVYFKENGLNVKDAELVGQGAFDEAFIALKQGEVDAAWFTGSALIDKLVALDSVHELGDMSKTSVRLGTGLVAGNELIEKQPEAVAGFLKAVDEAAAYSQAHPDETADLMYREVKQPKEATLKDLPNNPWNIGFTQAAYDSLENQKEYMVQSKIIRQDFDLKTKLGLEPLKQALPESVTYGSGN
ncbi:ABC transporter substrate-binding protein [Paenibacillus glufosinatiresistens]|uniref:ABC transporter substrate-binding protein n=1 Tax=Paenibacillus glufosinatiresistens TaxID=3070657 RepID=UPI00286E7E91|nr:ABC transporter substrate-binding protein [Paenibacillus sp. YX.27]